MDENKKQSFIVTFSLFTSFSTLLCCALPALLITIGLGAVVAGVTANIPAFIWLSEHKLYLFIFSGFMLILAGYFQFRPNQSCPVDPQKAAACQKLKKVSRFIFFISLLIYLVGFFFAYLIKYFL